MTPDLILRLVAIGVALVFLAGALAVWFKARAGDDVGCLILILLAISAALLLFGFGGTEAFR